MNQPVPSTAGYLISEGYRNAQLVVSTLGDEYLGQVTLWGEVLYWHHSLSVDSLIQHLRSWLDGYYQQAIKHREKPPTDSDYMQAVARIYPLLPPMQQNLMRFHAHCEQYQAAAENLLAQAGAMSYTQLLLDYAAISRRLSDALCYIPDLNEALLDPIVPVLLHCPTDAEFYQLTALTLVDPAGAAFRQYLE